MTRRWLLLDWGNTLMDVVPGAEGPMADWPEVAAVPGAFELLERLHGHYALVVASNARDSGPDDVRRALARVGLDQWVDHVFCPSTLGVGKESAAYYQRLMRYLGAQPADCVMVGDDWHGDVLVPVSLGLRAVWLNRLGAARPQGYLFETVGTLKELAVRLSAEAGWRR